MPSTQSTATKRLFALGASRMPHSAKPSKDLRAHGGKVQGPGTPTSDSIDAKLSTDEFVLPADTTRKVGVERLRKLVALTHKPTGKAKKAQHYADGGLVEDEEKKNQTSTSSAGNPVVGAAALIPESASTPRTAAIAPKTPTREELIAQIPIENDRQAPERPEPGVIDSIKQTEFGRQAYNTMMAIPGVGGLGRVAATGGAISNGINRLAALGNAVAGDGAAQEAVSMVGDYARNFPVGEAQAGTLPDASTKHAVNAKEQAGAGVEPAAGATGNTTVDNTPNSPQIAPGIYKHGTGQYSDRAEGMNFGSNFTGHPSAADQDRAAALAQSTNPEAAFLQRQMQGDGAGGNAGIDFRAQRSPVGMTVQEAQAAGLIGERLGYDPAYDQRLNSSARTGSVAESNGIDGSFSSAAAGITKPRESWTDFTKRMIDLERGTSQGQVPQMRTPTVATSLNDWSVRKRLENLKTSASSIMNTRRWGGKNAHLNPAVQAYQKALEEDTQAISNGQASMDAKAMEANAGLQREGMVQVGANKRTLLQEAGAERRDARRSGLDDRRLGMEAQEHSLRLRGLSRTDALQDELLNAQTPAQASSARQRLLALQGRTGAEQSKWKSAYDRDGNPFLFNEQTAETMTPGVSQPSAKPKEGSYVQGPDGRQYVVRNGKPVLVGGAK